jgi:hypothetical protein
MAESTVVRVKRDGQILLADSGAAHTYTVAYEPGDFGYNVPDSSVNQFLDRGEMGATPTVRIGDDAPMTGSFTAYLRDLGDTGAAYATLLDVAHRYAAKYVATNWVSTLGANSDVFTITISLTIDGSPFGESDKTVTFPFSVFRANAKEGDPNMIDASFTSFAVRPLLS